MPSERTIVSTRKNHAPQRREDLHISACMIAFNEAEYIEYSVASVYDFVHEIIIVEGAVQKMKHATPDGHSTDATLKRIESIADPKRKIKLISLSKGKFWANKQEMRNAYMEVVTGNFLLTLDADEVYRKEHLEKIISTVMANPKKTCFPLPFYHFWKDLWHITIGSMWDVYMPRHYRLRGGETYSRTHNVLSDRSGVPMNGLDRNGPYINRSLIVSSVRIYHYGYAKKQRNVVNKLQYYKNRGQAVADTFSAWKPGQHTQPTNRGETRVVPFGGPHPEVMKRHPYYSVHAITLPEEE